MIDWIFFFILNEMRWVAEFPTEKLTNWFCFAKSYSDMILWEFVIPAKAGIQTLRIMMDSASKPALNIVEWVRNDNQVFE